MALFFPPVTLSTLLPSPFQAMHYCLSMGYAYVHVNSLATLFSEPLPSLFHSCQARGPGSELTLPSVTGGLALNKPNTSSLTLGFLLCEESNSASLAPRKIL